MSLPAMSLPGIVHGVVRNTAGKPIFGAKIFINKQLRAVATSDSVGYYRFCESGGYVVTEMICKKRNYPIWTYISVPYAIPDNNYLPIDIYM